MSDSGWQKFHVLTTQRRYAQAEEAARTMIVADPADDLGYGLLAQALREQKKYVPAKGAIEEAIRLSPDTDAHLFSLANIHLSVGEFKDALRVIDQAIEMNPSDSDHHHLRAVALLRLDRNKEALVSAEAGLALDPQDSGLQTTRAEALHALGEAVDAKAELLKQLAEDPNDDVIHCRLGEVLLVEGRHEEAAQHFREALRIDPEFGRARYGLIEALKSRSHLYSGLLRFGYWASTLPRGMVSFGLLGGIVAAILIGRASANPLVTWAMSSLVMLVIAISQLPLIANALTTLALRMDRRNRIILSRRQCRVSNWQIAPLLPLGLTLLLSSFVPRVTVVIGLCVFARATDALEYVSEPASRKSRFRLWLLYLAGFAVGAVAVLWTTGAGLVVSLLIGIWFSLSAEHVLRLTMWTGIGLFVLSLYGCFELLEHWSRRLALRDRLAGHFHEDE